MMEFATNNYQCRFEKSGNDNFPLVMLLSGYDEELHKRVFEELLKIYGGSIILAEASVNGEIDWDKEYSPWEAEINGRFFSGGARGYLLTVKKAAEEIKSRFKVSEVYLAGYSLGGLCALYAGVSDKECFYSGVGSCSGSLWFTGFLDYLNKNPLHGKIYLSLGGKEKNSSDPIMVKIEEYTNTVKKIAELSESVSDCCFNHEAGGHFSKIPLRIAHCINWLLCERRQI